MFNKGGMGNLMKQAQMMQENMKRAQAELANEYRDWETDRKSTRLNSSHLKLSRMPSSA